MSRLSETVLAQARTQPAQSQSAAFGQSRAQPSQNKNGCFDASKGRLRALPKEGFTVSECDHGDLNASKFAEAGWSNGQDASINY